MAKVFKKNKRNNEPVPVATTIETVDGTEYGVADYSGRKTYFEKDDNGAFSIPSQDSDLNPHLFPAHKITNGKIDNSEAIFKQEMPTKQQGQQMRSAFRDERRFNKSLNKDGIYNIGDAEMARNNLSLNPKEVNLDFLPFANNVMPGDKPYLAGMQNALMAQPSYSNEFVQDQIRQQMQGGIPYEQAVADVTGRFTGPLNQMRTPVVEKQIFTGRNETILPDGMKMYVDPATGIRTPYSNGGASVINMDDIRRTPKAFTVNNSPVTPPIEPIVDSVDNPDNDYVQFKEQGIDGRMLYINRRGEIFDNSSPKFNEGYDRSSEYSSAELGTDNPFLVTPQKRPTLSPRAFTVGRNGKIISTSQFQTNF